MSTSALSALFNFCIISINSSYLNSAHDNVIKRVGTTYCFTNAKTSDLNFFQHAGVALNEFINVKAWSFSTY